MGDVAGRVVVVTGGASGIGKAIASSFVEAGEQVIIFGRDAEKLRTAAGELGRDTVWLRADVSRRHEVFGAIGEVVRRFGRVDVLVNNAGFVEGVETTMNPSEAERMWDAVLDTNLKGAFLMALAVAPHLPRPGGRIINISSIAAFTGGSRPGAAAYAAAKAGLHGLTYSLARELSPQGITVNVIAPGFIANTGFTGHWPDERVQRIVSETPVGRPGRAEDVASAAVYLASPQASFVTGEVLNVNGGWLFGR